MSNMAFTFIKNPNLKYTDKPKFNHTLSGAYVKKKLIKLNAISSKRNMEFIEKMSKEVFRDFKERFFYLPLFYFNGNAYIERVAKINIEGIEKGLSLQ
jgi:hypothetical protein